MQILMSYDNEDSPTLNLESISGLREFIYQNSTKKIFSFIGDHVVGKDAIEDVSIGAQQYKYIKKDQVVSKKFLGIPTKLDDKIIHTIEMKGIGESKLRKLSEDEENLETFISSYFIEYDFRVDQIVEEYFEMKDIIAELGGIYTTIGLVLGKAAAIFVIQYWLWFGGARKRKSRYLINRWRIERAIDYLKKSQIAAQVQNLL